MALTMVIMHHMLLIYLCTAMHLVKVAQPQSNGSGV